MICPRPIQGFWIKGSETVHYAISSGRIPPGNDGATQATAWDAGGDKIKGISVVGNRTALLPLLFNINRADSLPCYSCQGHLQDCLFFSFYNSKSLYCMWIYHCLPPLFPHRPINLLPHAYLLWTRYVSHKFKPLWVWDYWVLKDNVPTLTIFVFTLILILEYPCIQLSTTDWVCFMWESC